jgi:phage protein D/phage baseplate assembly protein gpV
MPSQDNTPGFTITVDGEALTQEESNAVHEIKITDWLRLPDVCTVAVGYSADQPGVYTTFDSTKFKVGGKLEVKLGSAEESTTQSLFKGEIVTMEPAFTAGGVDMVVRAYDSSHKMMRTRKQRTFVNQTASDIVTSVAGEYGFNVESDSSGGPLDFVLQHNETDWEFVWRMARRNGFEFLVGDNGTATFKKPNVDGDPVELRYTDGLSNFRPRVTAVMQVEEVSVRGFDLKAKQKVEQTAKTVEKQVTEAGIKRSEMVSAFPGGKLEIAGQSFSSDGEAKTMAQATLDQLANAYLGAEGVCEGDPRIKAGAKLKISGVGQKFSGTYRVAKAIHTLSGGGGYQTAFSNSAGEHTLLGQSGGGNSNNNNVAIDSIVVAVVTNNDDPEKLGRVKVKFPHLTEKESFWAPVILPSAGNERGLSMLPVPDEQVVVAFENGDPSYPYVLGSVFNGKDKPGDEMAVTDGSFAMKSDHKALIAAKEDINLRTEKGKWVIEVKGGEIKETVNQGEGGGGAYTGKFDGKWGLTATQAIEMESQQSVKIKAPQIELEADGTMTLKANGQVSIQSQGQLELKGAQVSVNGSAMVAISGGLINIG